MQLDIHSLQEHPLSALCDGGDPFDRSESVDDDLPIDDGRVAAVVQPHMNRSIDTQVQPDLDAYLHAIDDASMTAPTLSDQLHHHLQSKDVPFHMASIGGTSVVQFNDGDTSRCIQIDDQLRSKLDQQAAIRRTRVGADSGDHDDNDLLLLTSHNRLKVNEDKSHQSSQKILSMLKARNDKLVNG